MRSMVGAGWFVSAVAVLGVGIALAGGALLTGRAVVAGDPGGALLRFVAALALGIYYSYLYHLSRGRRPFGTG